MSRRALPVAWFWGECGEGTTQTCLARLKPKFSESESTYECYCNVLLWTLCWCSVGSQQAIMESPVVCLNVAGCYFTTARETILREPASKLALQLRGVLPTLKDDAGHVFIDRDPRFFQAILNYLRDGWTLLPPTASERRELMQEVRFYQVRFLSGLPLGRINASISLSTCSGRNRKEQFSTFNAAYFYLLVIYRLRKN